MIRFNQPANQSISLKQGWGHFLIRECRTEIDILLDTGVLNRGVDRCSAVLL